MAVEMLKILIPLSVFIFIMAVAFNNFFLGFRSKNMTIEDIPFAFENYYANWHHKTEYKNAVLFKIRAVIAKYNLDRKQNLNSEALIQLESQTLNEIRKLTYAFSDAHVTFEINQKNTESSPAPQILKSQIHIDFNTLTLNFCLGCEKLIGSKITGIDGYTLSEWDNFTEAHDFPLVSYSSETGRLYKKMKFLETFPTNQPANSRIKSVQLEDSLKNKTNLILDWKESNVANQSNVLECVRFERLASNRVTVHLFNFWCTPDNDRKTMIMNFKQQYLNALIQIKPQDEVTIDVSRNSGGGDEEVDYVLSSLIPVKAGVPYYSYQFLKRTALVERTFTQLQALFKSLFDFQSEWLPIVKYQINWDKQLSQDNFIGHQVKEVKISPLCSSACDLFVLALKQNQQFKFSGIATQGSLGLPKSYKINAHYSDHVATLTLPSCRIFDDKMQLMEGVSTVSE
jgi:hypothetical protein